MSNIKLIKGSGAVQNVDAVVNAANRYLYAGGGICGAIFEMAGYEQLEKACRELNVTLNDGDAVITPSFNMKNCKYIIHAVGPNFSLTPDAFDKLFNAYYNSLIVLKENNLESIAFPLISSGIYGGRLENPVYESTKQCLEAYKKFIEDYKEYDVQVKLCAYSDREYQEASKVFALKKL